MKFHYIFLDTHNGHMSTFHPFVSNTLLTQERVTKWLSEIPGARRMGTYVNQLLDRLDKEKIPYEPFICPCCDIEVRQISDVNSAVWKVLFIEWILLECVSGNY